MYSIRCPGCDLHVLQHAIKPGESMRCPRCDVRLAKFYSSSLYAELALALTTIILAVPAYYFPLITIDLFSAMIPASVLTGTITLFSTFPFIAALVLFCSVIAPVVYSLGVIGAYTSLHFHSKDWLRRSLNITSQLKYWVMADVFLISLAISCFKVKDYAEIFVGPGLYCFVILQVVYSLLLSRFSTRRIWNAYQQESDNTEIEGNLISCHHCSENNPIDATSCQRCGSTLHTREPLSIQKTWAYLISATVFIFPANLFPISILLTNGKRLEDTIFSGVASLIKNGMTGIAIIIFTASIIVPVAKILGLGFILFCIHTRNRVYQRFEMKLYGIVQWIGKWSMMDLFVIALMVALIDRGQILDFTPGPGAVAFGLVVVLTMLAAESLDSRLIWDKNE
ncbi:paraquat-inducible protein A [Parasalinivibrio latis]|uniref:PqiA/YebS family transporter subunit n=1 Tax=Parasalinivibrio latis TaxID=2952610 RepID=UPI0030E4DC80